MNFVMFHYQFCLWAGPGRSLAAADAAAATAAELIQIKNYRHCFHLNALLVTFIEKFSLIHLIEI